MTSLYAQNKRRIFVTNAQTHRYIFYHSERTRSILFFLIFRQCCGFRYTSHRIIGMLSAEPHCNHRYIVALFVAGIESGGIGDFFREFLKVGLFIHLSVKPFLV